jgi:hypothetical protein
MTGGGQLRQAVHVVDEHLPDPRQAVEACVVQADRIREVDDPPVRPRPLRDHLGDTEPDRHGAQRLGEAAGSGGLLPEHRRVWVDQPRSGRPGLALAVDTRLEAGPGRRWLVGRAAPRGTMDA